MLGGSTRAQVKVALVFRLGFWTVIGIFQVIIDLLVNYSRPILLLGAVKHAGRLRFDHFLSGIGNRNFNLRGVFSFRPRICPFLRVCRSRTRILPTRQKIPIF